MSNDTKIAIAGAGSIGCFVGGLLLAAGHSVVFLGRKRLADELNAHGLHLTDYTGMLVEVPAKALEIDENPAFLSEADIILVCTKSAATAEMARLILEHARTSATVVSLQNGLRNADVLKKHLPEHDVRAGMVGFNVIHTGNGSFHRGTSSGIVIEQGIPDVAGMLQTEHISIESATNITNVQWGKFLLNLNNSVNAISGLPLKQQLSDRKWRLIMADQITEGLSVLKAAGIKPEPPTPAPAWALPHILRLPNFLFEIVAKQMLAIDPKARSSMAEDVEQGRKTEIDEFQGEIIRLGRQFDVQTPVSQDIFSQVRKIENAM